MPGRRSKPVMVIAGRKKDRIMEMVCEGKTLTEVGQIVGLTVARISQIAKEKREEWAAKNEIVVGDHIAVEIARLDRIIQQADRTYQRSLKDARKVVTHRSEAGESQTETVEGQAGDMAALGVKLRAVEMKLKLLNAFPKEEQSTNVVINQWEWGELSKPIPIEGKVLSDVKPSDEIEARIAAELEAKPSTNGNGKH